MRIETAFFPCATLPTQGEALQASMELTRLREDLKLATGRLNTATGQAADLLQQLKSVQAENASLMSQLALSQGRDTEAAAAHATLQQALEGMRADLQGCVLTCSDDTAGPACNSSIKALRMRLYF